MQRTAANHRTRQWGLLVAISVLVWHLSGIGVTPVQAYEQLGPNTRSDFRLWAPVYLTVNLPNRFLAYMEVNTRIGDDVTNIDQLLLRPAIGYKLTDNISIWQGYAWVGNFNQSHTFPQSPFFEENRIYQQVNYTTKLGDFKFLSRTRLEERWIEHADGTAVRFRQMFRFTYPLPMAPDIGLVVYDEIFANANTVGSIKGKGPQAGFDQNRFFLGINKTFNQYLNVDLGYQNQLLNQRSLPGNANLVNHILLIQFFITL
ncbi:MAG: DUF2490 domain-containing protein [Nitrospira sp.]|nr:DUF2490 domain-containing protein [Nitrospira sp.]MDH5195081.1 DUF2490 domain-containing protein [Nitrospira sp.]